MAQSLGDYHIRGLTDSGGSPDATIATVAVQHFDDGSLKATLSSGRVLSIRDQYAKLLFEAILGVDFTNLG